MRRATDSLPGVRRLEVKRRMEPADIAAVVELLELAEDVDERRALSDHQWLDLVQGGRAGFAGLVAWEPGHEHPVAYAQVARGNDSWGIELVVAPHHRDELVGIGAELLTAALDVVGDEGGGHVHLWVYRPTAAHEELARRCGMRPGRLLLQLRRTLPLPETSTLPVRPFEPGRDDDAWLAVNNRAFSAHPEQGAWTRATLAARQHEPWFDPEGFLLHERHGRLVAFCWTKVHAGSPSLGEIYVVAVDPDAQGRGLGREIVLAGLDHLAARGIPIAMLHVDADNAAARALYAALGFEEHHADRAFVLDVAPDHTGGS